MKQDFRELIKKKIVILDGATGSALQKAGMPSGVCPEQWIIEHPQPLVELQQAYAAAGSDIVYAPTFGANPIKLREYGLEEKTVELNTLLVNISRDAVGNDVLVAGDMTMTGQQLAPLGTLTVEELIEAYKVQVKALADAGVDLIVIETMMRLAEARAALIAVKETCDIPVLVSMSFNENGKTLYGTDAATAVEVLQGLGADVVGMNCGAGPDKMLPVLQEMLTHASVPVAVKPNAGLPKLGADGLTIYDMEAEPFAIHLTELMKQGAGLVGGCCGTDPEYIRLTVQAADALSADDSEEKVQRAAYAVNSVSANSPETKVPVYLTTERASFLLDDDTKVGMIDPAEDEELMQEYQDGEFDTLLDLVDEQLDEEADVICLSVDGEGIDGEAIITQVIEEVSQTANLPLAFTSENPAVLEAALRNYPGRAGIVPKENDTEVLENLCRKYGAVII